MEPKIFFTSTEDMAVTVATWYRAGLTLYIEQGCGGGWFVTITGSKI